MARATSGAPGFSLVEVLVALVVLAIGLLGSATLLLEALSSDRIALERSRAVMLASDMLERIRANREAGAAYDSSGAGAPARDPDCEQPDAGCSAASMASHDLRIWLDAVAAQLPGGVGTVEVVPLAGRRLRCTVRITWARSGAGQPASVVLDTEA